MKLWEVDLSNEEYIVQIHSMSSPIWMDLMGILLETNFFSKHYSAALPFLHENEELFVKGVIVQRQYPFDAGLNDIHQQTR